MRSIKVELSNPVAVDVEEIAKDFANYRYRGPIKADRFLKEDITSEYISDDNRGSYPEIIIGFDGKTEDGFTKVITDLTKEEFSFKMSRLSHKYQELISNILQGTKLEIIKLSNQEKHFFEQKILVFEQKNKILEECNDIGFQMNSGKFTSETAKNIMQHSVGFTHSDDEYPILGTFGAGPCIRQFLIRRLRKLLSLILIALQNLVQLMIFLTKCKVRIVQYSKFT